MKKNLKSLIFVTGVVILGLILFNKSLNTKPTESIQKALSVIFSESKITPQEDLHHYKINSKDYFIKSIKSNYQDILVVAENKTKYSSTYSFYSDLENPRKLIEVESLPLSDASTTFNKNFFLKDITGDGIEEIFVVFESTGYGLSGYTVLRHIDNSLETMTIDNDTLVHFDEIEYKNSEVSMISHGSGFRGKAFYEINENNLIYKQSIGFFAVPNVYSDEYEVRKSGNGGVFKVVDRKKGNIWTDSFEPYE